ncbi:cytochrome P450 [Schizophyllum amplum]|uniref:Cytochrome P450 n=1 Tax=Schizophyllum amplum TaxID=97359 RepID=A0A550CP92_9AGAR|nr:cytochrome P450 [Auriculariopsis ampla]
MAHPASRYHRRVLRELACFIILPCIVTQQLLRWSSISIGALTVPTYIAGVALWIAINRIYSTCVQALDRRRKGARSIPCVKGRLPGNIDILFRMMKDFKTSYVLDVYLRLFKEYNTKTLNLRILWVDSIITMDQEHSKFILAAGFHNFWRGPAQKERMETFLGEGIFNRDDESWKAHRAVARPFFARDRISDLDTFARYTQRTLDILADSASKNEPVDVQDLFSRFTLDATSEFLFGSTFETLSGMRPVAGSATMGPKGAAAADPFGSFVQAFEEAQVTCTKRARIGHFWPLFELSGDANSENAEHIRRWLDPLVEHALRNKAQRKGIDSPLAERNFLEHLAQSTDDPIVIRDQLLSMLLAARDTTACLLTYVVYLLALHPDILAKLRAETLGVCGPNSSPSPENLRSLKYARAVINETLRLFPPVPLNVRATRDASCAFPFSDTAHGPVNTLHDSRPLYIPKCTTVLYLPLLTQRDPELWGQDADVFDPDRWLDDRLARFVHNPAMFAPFSAGPRVCIGQNYAYNQATFFLVKLLQRFDTFTLAPEVQPAGSLPPEEWKDREGRQRYERIWPSNAMTLYIKGGLWVRISSSQPRH